MEARKLVTARLFFRSVSSLQWSKNASPSLLPASNVRGYAAWFPKLESATARARKRRRRVARLEMLNAAASQTPTMSTGSSIRNRKPIEVEEDDIAPAYPEGKPWRVLWPNPHGNPAFVTETKAVRRIPRWRDIKRAWAAYLETWEDGLRGIPSPEKLREREALEQGQAITLNPQDEISGVNKLESNVSQNMQVARDSAKDLLEQAKEKTDLHSRDDLQRVAADMMRLATECLKEFMAGYRQGRDQEVDKMLHEYFQDENQDARSAAVADSDTLYQKKSKRRKARRAILR